MSTPLLDQSEAEARLQTLQLGSRYLTAALETHGQTVEAPKLSDDVFENIAALENHCGALEAKLSALPAVSVTDGGSIAALTKERDEYKSRAEKSESDVVTLNAKIAGMEEDYQRKLAAAIVKHGIRHTGGGDVFNPSGKKLSADQKVQQRQRGPIPGSRGQSID